MSHPYHHAVSSAKLFGGEPADYLAIHQWFDASKIAAVDQRHRAFRHHSEAISDLKIAMRAEKVLNADGVPICVTAIGLQHLAEDFGGYVPCFAEWMQSISVRPWMDLAISAGKDEALKICARRYGGNEMDYCVLADWVFEGTTDDPRTYLRRGHAMGSFWAEEIFGVAIEISTGKVVPTRLAVEIMLSCIFRGRFIPTPWDWVRSINGSSWQKKPRLLA